MEYKKNWSVLYYFSIIVQTFPLDNHLHTHVLLSFRNTARQGVT